MDAITTEQKRVLEVLDEEIEKLEEKLAKVQPYINRLNKLKQTRRVLLAEKGTTGGGGHPNAQLTQEMVITFLREVGSATPQQISERFGVPGATVRSHLNRHKDTTYERENGTWQLIEGEDEEEE